MLTRRHIRARVMQAVYAYRQGQPEEVKPYCRRFLAGLEKISDLYALQASLLDALVRKASARIETRRSKRLASPDELAPNTRFAHNPFSDLLEQNKAYRAAVERYASLWADRSEYVENLLGAIESSPRYRQYMESSDDSFAAHKQFFIHAFRNIVAPDESLADFYEDRNMDWVSDMQVANTMLLKTLEDVKEGDPAFSIPSLFKDSGDREFASALLEKTICQGQDIRALIEQKAENWDPERIAAVDFILMEMAVVEFTCFPSIPIRVTLNEYIEISKEYSTPKSGSFINGILDRVEAELSAQGKITKSGRGLM